MIESGGLSDAPAGWRSYADYLAWQVTDGPAGKSKAYVSMSKGWALGGNSFKQTLLQEHAVAVDIRAWESEGVREVREAHWQKILDRLREQIPAKAMEDERKSAPWRVQIAEQMKSETDASNGWLAVQLGMGSAVYLSKHVGLARKKVKGKA